jgi:hypothetical protein
VREVMRVLKRWVRRGTVLALVGFVAVVASTACAASRPGAPTVGEGRGQIPDLRGQRVMVLPIQRTTTVRDDADSEIEYVFSERGEGVDWVFPGELSRALERSPGMQTSARGLPVSMFLESEVNRVGDPLYGRLRRLGALVNSDLVFLPVRMRYSAVNTAGEMGIEISAALIQVRTGRVVWYGVVGGQPGPVDNFANVATAVEALAAQVLWFTR